MWWTRNLIVSLILMWVVGACLKQPENSIIPVIQLQSINFKHEFPKSADTLIVTLKFTDGDGDLGIAGDETAIYRSDVDSTDINTPYYYVYDTTKNTIWYYTHRNNETLPQGYKYVDYSSKRLIHTTQYDTLPELTCKDWEYRASPADTLYIQNNPYNNNIFVYLYTKNTDGSYSYFDPTSYFAFGTQCTTNFFNGRFPILSSDLGKKSSLDGTITYKIQSSALYLLFHGKTLQLKIYILD